MGDNPPSGQRELPPLSLYIHLPWCLRKCSYCDFNSHALDGPLPEQPYVQALLADLDEELRWQPVQSPLTAIFLGGGTPSLLSANAVEQLLPGIRARVPWVPGIEISLEANPATAEARRFAGYREAGINRLSLGVQSFSDAQLKRLGRLHSAGEAVEAVALARRAGFDRLNLDLIYGLPEQTLEAAAEDLARAIDLTPDHLSYYQLSIEPHTLFSVHPPLLPDHDLLAEMYLQGQALLQAAGYEQYEISAYARPGQACRHNLNYWQFGDYLGIGAGAHGKRTDAAGIIWRRVKQPHPKRYLQAESGAQRLFSQTPLQPEERKLEFLLNAFRLTAGFDASLFTERTGLSLAAIQPGLQRAEAAGLLRCADGWIQLSPRGQRFVDTLLRDFF